MYVYKISTNRYDTHTKDKKDAFEVDKEARRDKYYSSRVKALDYLAHILERYTTRRGCSLLNSQGDKNLLECDFFKVELIDSDNNLIEYGYHTVTEIVLQKIEVM